MLHAPCIIHTSSRLETRPNLQPSLNKPNQLYVVYLFDRLAAGHLADALAAGRVFQQQNIARKVGAVRAGCVRVNNNETRMR